MKCQINLDIYNRKLRPSAPAGAFALYKRFRRKRKPWRRADSLPPEHVKSFPVTKNSHTFRCSYFLEGTELKSIFSRFREKPL